MLIALLGFGISSNAFAKKGTQGDTAVMMGKVVKEAFSHGKDNKPIEGVYDYFFQSGDKKYFIKTYKAKFGKDELEKWVGQSVQAKVIFMARGNWDDNGQGQSRVGEYIIVLSIKKV